MTSPRVAVIGAGFGGLAAAIRSQSAGVPTVLIEQRDRPGGRAYVYEQDGFTFDAGPTVITAPTCLTELYELSGRSMSDYIELIKLDPMYRLIWEDGYTLDYTADHERMNAQIAARNPADVDGYRRFLEYSEEVFLEGYEKLAAEPFLDWWSMIRAAPQLVRLQSYRSVYSKVSQYIKDPQLRQALSYHTLLVGGNPFSTSAIYALIHALERRWGVLFPRGGTGALVQALAKLFQDLGGELWLNAPVDRIETQGGRVQAVNLEDGRRVPVEAVVSNADVMYTYSHMLRDEPLLDGMRRSLSRKEYSMSLFVIYFGLKRQHPDLAHHAVLFGPRYKALLDDIFHRGKLADDFSLYVHAPSVSDPNLAPPGCSAYYVLAPVPNFARGEIDWEQEAPRFRDRILDYVEKRYIPGLREDLVTSRMFTPRDFVTELNAYQAAAFSLQPLLTQSAFFRVHNRDERVAGLYFTGAGTHPGAGVPGVVNSAKATAKLMLSDLGIQ
jgi:phytoene desaturase